MIHYKYLNNNLRAFWPAPWIFTFAPPLTTLLTSLTSWRRLWKVVGWKRRMDQIGWQMLTLTMRRRNTLVRLRPVRMQKPMNSFPGDRNDHDGGDVLINWGDSINALQWWWWWWQRVVLQMITTMGSFVLHLLLFHLVGFWWDDLSRSQHWWDRCQQWWQWWWWLP